MPHREESPENNFLAGQILHGLQSTNELIQNLSKEIQAHAVNLATIKVGLSNIDDTVSSLSKILKEGGDGQVPLLSRMAVLEKVTETLTVSIHSMEKNLEEIATNVSKARAKIHILEQEFNTKNSQEKLEKAAQLEERKSKKQATMTYFAAIAAFITSIVSAIVSYFLNS